ncbi:MAG: hypothetical protein QMD71_01750 [bacterium]|nr:hypothetical protein [bacterium]
MRPLSAQVIGIGELIEISVLGSKNIFHSTESEEVNKIRQLVGVRTHCFIYRPFIEEFRGKMDTISLYWVAMYGGDIFYKIKPHWQLALTISHLFGYRMDWYNMAELSRGIKDLMFIGGDVSYDILEKRSIASIGGGGICRGGYGMGPIERIQLQNSLEVHLFGRVESQIAQNIALFMSMRYIRTDLKGRCTVTNMRLDGMALQLGVSFYIY